MQRGESIGIAAIVAVAIVLLLVTTFAIPPTGASPFQYVYKVKTHYTIKWPLWYWSPDLTDLQVVSISKELKFQVLPDQLSQMLLWSAKVTITLQLIDANGRIVDSQSKTFTVTDTDRIGGNFEGDITLTCASPGSYSIHGILYSDNQQVDELTIGIGVS
jgi:hypothetical protein